jgi:hypothetical protein
MKTHRILACASAVLFLANAAAAGQATPAASGTTGQAAAPATAKAKFVTPVRGTAEVEITKPATKRDSAKNEIVTVIKIKNVSATNSIVGLKVEDYWYDKAGNAVTGDQYRHRKPLLPGEVLEITLRTPVSPKMDRNQYKFEHANGSVNPKVVPKL